MRQRIPVRTILVFGSEHRVDVDGQLIGKHQLTIDDLHARAKRRTARRVADREKQFTARLKDVLKRITRFGQTPSRSPIRTVPARPASFTSSAHVAQNLPSAIGSIELQDLPPTGQSLHRPRLMCDSSTAAMDLLATEAEVRRTAARAGQTTGCA
jgi:hypothetical protein